MRQRAFEPPQVLQFAVSMNAVRLAFGRLLLHQISNMLVTRRKGPWMRTFQVLRDFPYPGLPYKVFCSQISWPVGESLLSELTPL
jgi:hypothetical protein